MTDSTNHNRAERRRESRRKPAQPSIYYRPETPQIRAAIAGLLHSQDPEICTIVATYGLTYMLNRQGFSLQRREVEVLMRTYYRAITDRIKEGESSQDAQYLALQELLSGEVLHVATPEELEALRKKKRTSEPLGCPDTCYTSGKPPHVRHYHGTDCPLSSLRELSEQTCELPGLCQIAYQDEKTRIAVHIITKNQETAVLWLKGGTHEYHLPIGARLAFHKGVLFQLVRLEEDQPVYEVQEKQIDA